MADATSNTARWARFTANAPPGMAPDFERINKFWNSMKIEFMTHHAREDAGFTVIVKSKHSQRKTKWTKFMNLFLGHTLEMIKGRRHDSPIRDLRDTPLYDEVHRNVFTTVATLAQAVPATEQEAPVPPAAMSALPEPERNQETAAATPECFTTRLFAQPLALNKVLPSPSHRGALQKTVFAVFGQEWSRGSCVDLRVFWLLEVHRRVLRLEQTLTSRGADVQGLSVQRRQAFEAKKYVLIDPITLAVPMLLGHLRGGFDLHADTNYRLAAVTASIHPLLRYGMDLTAVARASLPAHSLVAAEACLFDWPFAFLPAQMQATLAASPTPNAAANIERRAEKEQVRPRPRPAPPALTGCPRRATCASSCGPTRSGARPPCSRRTSR